MNTTNNPVEPKDENALNDAAWKFIENTPEGGMPTVLWNNLKAALWPAIQCYNAKAERAATQTAGDAVRVYEAALTALETLRGCAATYVQDHSKDTYPGNVGVRPQDVANMWAQEILAIDAKAFLDEAIDEAPPAPVQDASDADAIVEHVYQNVGFTDRPKLVAEVSAMLAAPAVQAAPVGDLCWSAVALAVDEAEKRSLDYVSTRILRTLLARTRLDTTTAPERTSEAGERVAAITDENLRALRSGCSPVNVYSLDCARAGDHFLIAAPAAKQEAGELPPLPQPSAMVKSSEWQDAATKRQSFNGWRIDYGDCDMHLFTADQMHAYVLADRAARQSPPTVTGTSDEKPSDPIRHIITGVREFYLGMLSKHLPMEAFDVARSDDATMVAYQGVAQLFLELVDSVIDARSPVAAAPCDRNAVLEEAARVSEQFGPNRPIVSVRPSAIVQGRWEGEQAASKNIADAIRKLKTAAPESAEPSADSIRLDWLDQQGHAYGFEDMHEGNRWVVEGPFANLREAIDAARLATSSAAKGVSDGN